MLNAGESKRENNEDFTETKAEVAKLNDEAKAEWTHYPKQKLTLSIDKEIIERAKEAGINISAITEKVLGSLTMDRKGATHIDVKRGYEELFLVIREALKKYNANVNVGVIQGEEPDNEGDMVGDDVMLTPDGLYAISFSHRWRTVQPEEVEKFGQWLSPFEILQKFLKSLISAAEVNGKELKELNIALRFVKALSAETGSSEGAP